MGDVMGDPAVASHDYLSPFSSQQPQTLRS